MVEVVVPFTVNTPEVVRPPAFQVPVVIVPKVARLAEPPQVERAVFSTRFNLRVDFKLAVEVAVKRPDTE